MSAARRIPSSRIGAALVGLTLGGCIGGPLGPGAGPATGSDAGGRSSPTETAPSRPASDALRRVARDAEASGDYGAAAAALERALRIEPTDPLLWLELGELRLATGDAAQARAMALKALSLAGASTPVEAGARRLLEAAGGP